MKLISQRQYHKADSQQYTDRNNYSNVRGKNIYFIGIGGVGMSAIAKLLIDEGCYVSGSDLQSSPITHNLERLGAKINTSQDGKGINPYTNLVIKSAAINENNPDLNKVKALGIEVIKCSEFLGSLMKNRLGIAVSGTHGKTTTSAIISVILKSAGHDPAFVIGGDVEGIGSSSSAGNGSIFVTEACEYDRTFLNLSPQIGVITNIDGDHLDYYKDINDVTDAFSEFVSLIPADGLLVINNDDLNSRKVVESAKCRVERFSVITPANDHLPDYVIRAGRTSMFNNAQLDLEFNAFTGTSNENVRSGSDTKWLAVVHYFDKEESGFSVFNEGEYFGDFCLKAPGLHNVSNALAAISVCHFIGLKENAIQKALTSFSGVNRRFQTISNKGGVTIIDDYAHHPTEIRTTLETARAVYRSQRLWCVFQPHQYNRTRLLLKEFAEALTLADKVIITDIYAARDTDMDKASVSSLDLVHELSGIGVDVKYIKFRCRPKTLTTQETYQ